MYWSRLFFLGLILSQMACGTAGTETSNADSETPDIFFDTKKFIEEKKTMLTTTNTILKLQVDINGEAEEKILEAPNWNELLKPFDQANINRTAWKDDYTVTQEKKGRSLHKYYTANNESLKTRSVETIQDDEEYPVHYIKVLNESSNFIYSSKEELVFNERQLRFKIDREQQYFFFDPEVVSILGQGLRR